MEETVNIPSRNTINLESIDNASRENFVQLLNPCFFFFRNLMRKTKRKKKNENNVYRLASVACTGYWFRLVQNVGFLPLARQCTIL